MDAKQLTENQFPVISADPLASKNLSKLIENINIALTCDSITASAHKLLKSRLEKVSEALLTTLSNNHMRNNAWKNIPEKIDALNLSCTYPAHFDGKSYKLNKMPESHPIKDDFIRYATEINALYCIVKDLASKITKRADRPAEERDEHYIPPVPTTAAATACAKVLHELSDNLTKEYADTLYAEYAMKVINKIANPRRRNDPYNPTFTDAVLMPLVGTDWDSFNGCYNSLVDGYRDILRKTADEQAAWAQDRFIYKNVMKLATIVERKGNLSNSTVIKGVVDRNGFGGEIRFEFADGSKFIVRNKIVLKYSVHGNPFLQAPTTFHNAVLPNGSVMPGQPSEEDMVEVFATNK